MAQERTGTMAQQRTGTMAQNALMVFAHWPLPG